MEKSVAIIYNDHEKFYIINICPEHIFCNMFSIFKKRCTMSFLTLQQDFDRHKRDVKKINIVKNDETLLCLYIVSIHTYNN